VGSDIEVIEVNLRDCMLEHYIKIGAKYQTYNLENYMLSHLAAMNKNDIFVADSMVFKRNVEPGWRLVLNEGEAFYHHRFNQLNRYKMVRSFFSSSDVLMSFMKLPIVEDIINDRIKNKLSTLTSMKKIFLSGGFDLLDRPFF